MDQKGAIDPDRSRSRRVEEELGRRDAILRAVAFAASRILGARDWRTEIDASLQRLGEASDVSRCCVFENDTLEDGSLAASIRFEWASPGVVWAGDMPYNQHYPYAGGFLRWVEVMSAGGVIQGLVPDFPEDVRAAFEPEGVLSIAAVPIFVGREWWGYLGFDDCRRVRRWSDAEIQVLSTAAATIGAAIEGELVRQRLWGSERRQRELVENLPAVVYTDTPAGLDQVTWVSPQYERLFGYTPEERLSQPDLWTRMTHPDDLGALLRESARTEATGERFSMEYRVFAKSGALLWIRDEALLIRDEGGVPVEWLGVITDITERKLAEEAAIRQGRILDAVAYAAESFLKATRWEEVIDDVLSHIGQAAEVSRCYIYENYEGEDGRGRSKLTHEWTAPGVTSDLDESHAHDYDREREGYPRWQRQLASGGAIHSVVADLPEPEQTDLALAGILSIAAVPVFDAGEWWGYFGFDECASPREWTQAEIEALKSAAALLGSAVQRNTAEQRLREAESQNRSIVESIPAAVYRDAVDAYSTMLFVSPYIKQLLGYSQEERLAAPRAWGDLLHPDDRERMMAYSDRTNETLEPFVADYRLIHRDGHAVWVHDEAVVIRDDYGKPLYWQGVLVDISDSKRAQEELQRALALEREAGERLRNLDEMKNTFLTAVSHDLRTPLAAVLGLALTLEREDVALDALEARDLAKRIAANARKLDRLVTDLLDLDRLSRGIVEPQLSTADVGLLARKVVREADYVQGYNVTLEVEQVVGRVDSTKVERIIENLLANAARHTPPGTDVWVKVWAEEGCAMIAVQDSGPGVLAELKEAIFEPFRQGSESSIPSPGVGIGLSLVARFAELHGGGAWVEDRVGGGASFKVRIPLGPAELAADLPANLP